MFMSLGRREVTWWRTGVSLVIPWGGDDALALHDLQSGAVVPRLGFSTKGFDLEEASSPHSFLGQRRGRLSSVQGGLSLLSSSPICRLFG